MNQRWYTCGLRWLSVKLRRTKHSLGDGGTIIAQFFDGVAFDVAAEEHIYKSAGSRMRRGRFGERDRGTLHVVLCFLSAFHFEESLPCPAMTPREWYPCLAVELHGGVVVAGGTSKVKRLSEHAFHRILPFGIGHLEYIAQKDYFVCPEFKFCAQHSAQAGGVGIFGFVTGFAVTGAQFTDFFIELFGFGFSLGMTVRFRESCSRE